MTSWLWWIMRVLLANQNGGNILNEQWKELKGRIWFILFWTPILRFLIHQRTKNCTRHVSYLSYLYPSFGILFPSWIYSYKVFQWYLGHSKKRKENRTFIHVTRLLAVRFSLPYVGMLHTIPWEGCVNHDLGTEGERQLRAGKSAERTKRNFRCPICCSAIGHASCLICTRHCQLTFPFSW